MNDKKDGGPAYPSKIFDHYESGVIIDNGDGTGISNTILVYKQLEGMSLRDYALIQFEAAWIGALSRRYNVTGYSDEYAAHEAHRLAVIGADSMIEARKK